MLSYAATAAVKQSSRFRVHAVFVAITTDSGRINDERGEHTWTLLRSNQLTAVTIYCAVPIQKHVYPANGIMLGVVVVPDHSVKNTASKALRATFRSHVSDACRRVDLIWQETLSDGVSNYYKFPQTRSWSASFEALDECAKEYARQHGCVCCAMYSTIKFQWVDTQSAHTLEDSYDDAQVDCFVKIEPFRVQPFGSACSEHESSSHITQISRDHPAVLARMYI